MKPYHKIQPLVEDKYNVIRFKENAIVRYLLDAGPFDMNQLAILPFDQNDREQFAQLIGYSVGGFSDLSYVSKKTLKKVDILEQKLYQSSKIKCKDFR